jgi:hypothetical protein
MTYFCYINDNIDRVKHDIKIGLISCSILKHYQIYSRYDYYKKLNNSTCSSIIYVCNDFQIEQRWAYKIIKKMEAEI